MKVQKEDLNRRVTKINISQKSVPYQQFSPQQNYQEYNQQILLLTLENDNQYILEFSNHGFNFESYLYQKGPIINLQTQNLIQFKNKKKSPTALEIYTLCYTEQIYDEVKYNSRNFVNETIQKLKKNYNVEIGWSQSSKQSEKKNYFSLFLIIVFSLITAVEYRFPNHVKNDRIKRVIIFVLNILVYLAIYKLASKIFNRKMQKLIKNFFFALLQFFGANVIVIIFFIIIFGEDQFDKEMKRQGL